MFGSSNIGTDYTFTQSDTQNTTASKSKPTPSKLGAGSVSGRDSLEAELKKVASQVSDANNQSAKSEDVANDYMYHSDGKAASITNSFDALAAAVGGVGGRVTKDQLTSYLHSLTSDPKMSAENLQEVTFIKGLIAQFDTLSGHSNYITSFADIKEPQDYKTVTKEQVTPPIDIRV